MEYGDNTYRLHGQSSTDNYLQLRHAYLSQNDSDWNKSDTCNNILSSGELITVRTFGRIETEVNDLKDGFKLQISVPSSQEYEQFTYVIH